MKIIKICLLLMTCGLLTFPVVAADLGSVETGVVHKHSDDLQEYYRLEKLIKEKGSADEEAQIDDETDRSVPPRPENGTRILINEIVTDPSEILSDAEIEQITSSYKGSVRSINDLFEMVDKLNALYRDKGFVTAKALLPPQKVENGVVKIRLVEGRVGNVLVEGNQHTRDSFVLNRFTLNQGELVRLDTLEQELIFFNAVNDIRIRATLRPGEATGETDLILNAEEPRNYEVSILSDNAGTETVGEERIGMKLASYSLLGFRDALIVSGYLSEGSKTLSAGYSVPINTLGSKLSIGYGLNRVEIQSGPFSDLDIGGDSYSYNINIDHPLIANQMSSMNLFAGYQYNNSNTDFSGVRIAQTKVDTFPFGFDYKRIDSRGLWYVRNTVTYGEERDVNDDNHFFLYKLDLVRSFVHNREVFSLIRANGQLSSHHPLVSTQQFQVGGLSSVRGYAEGYLVGDEGYFVSAETKFPLPFTEGSWREKVKGAVFIDHGAAFPYKGNNLSSNHEDFIIGTGIGLSINWSQYLTGRIDLGFPLAKHGDDIDSFRIHFTLQSMVF
ncbi:Hemolysin activation/secretion protein [Desulfuromusa kysingii]|uniref:Hemolysin activation/secretion protein n=1 Tax=Desulfuromusa kysingii TaxID=37625 RepID=A0A1H4EEH3_9BACT|nr:ShlB/FhaC/HecB family hemolysin secretion/activation protein [Desulfuromusa kysingii]SEA82990.1 Hemolysin activation/secretion protein [Desulfuromusa kysingii]